LPERLFRHLHATGPFTTILPDGSTVRLMSWGHRVENELFWRGWRGYEAEIMPWWLTFASEGGDILDIGANTATFSFIAKAISAGSRVYAFEPVSRIAAMARQNCEISGLPVEIVETAIADRKGRLSIYDPGGENAYSASLVMDFLPGEKQSYKVDVTTIDDFCAEKGIHPSLIKIDVEGAEERAIIGARRIMEKNDCNIICEWLGNSESHREAAAILRALDYVALEPSNLTEVELSDARGNEARNILLVPDRNRARLVRKWS